MVFKYLMFLNLGWEERQLIPDSLGEGHLNFCSLISFVNPHQVPVSQRPNLPITGATRSSLQPPRKVAVPGPTR